jgi:hypothetical protein
VTNENNSTKKVSLSDLSLLELELLLEEEELDLEDKFFLACYNFP